VQNIISQTARPQAAGSIKGGWLAPAGLLLLGLLPIIAGAFRLSQLSGMADVMPANPRYAAVPLPVVLHIVSATLFATLGPLQFAAAFRRALARLAPRGRATPRWLRTPGGADRALDDAVLRAA